MRKYKFITNLVLLFFITSMNVSAFSSDTYYVMESTAPTIDGSYDVNEWATEEENFQETISGLQYPDGSQSEMEIGIVIIRDTDNLYLLYKIFTPNPSDSNGSISAGIAINEKPFTGTMVGVKDRKLAYYNGSTTETHDLFACFACVEFSNRSFYPGIDDTTQDLKAEYGETTDFRFFEFSMPLTPTNNTEDSIIQEGTYIALVLNPYGNIWSGQSGHAGVPSSKFILTFEPKSFFQRPEEGISGLTLTFITIFSLLISALSVMFILSGRNDDIAKKMWAINVNEKSAQKSLFMEIAYYNSNFLSAMLMFMVITYSVISLGYGIWAQWGGIGLIITIIPLLLSIAAFVDLIKRNENPALKPKEERTKLGKDMDSSPALWWVPTGFLVLVLFMLTFIGIDVIT